MSVINTTRFVQPEIVSTHFHIQPGYTIADLGAGSGYFLPALTKAVGDSGIVYACDIQKSLVEKVGEISRKSGWENVRPLWCDIDEKDGIPLDPDSIDVAILVNTLFLLEKKEQAVKEIARIVRSGGRVYVIDWSESYGGLGPRDDMLISKEKSVALFESEKFVLETTYPAGDHHYGLSFRNA